MRHINLLWREISLPYSTGRDRFSAIGLLTNETELLTPFFPLILSQIRKVTT